jgi:hypothetical protein
MEARNELTRTIEEGLQAEPELQALAIQALIEARFIIKHKLMNGAKAQVDGQWVEAKQEAYHNGGPEAIKCFFGFHEFQISQKYRGTLTCFRCGKRKTGQPHY